MTLIELGEVSSGSPPEVPAARPRRPDIRRIAVLLVAVLCVLTVTGSERPDPRGLPVLWSVPFVGPQFTLTGDTLYLLGPDGSPDLTAYDAADGSIRWTRKAPGPGSWVNSEVPGLLLMPITAERMEDLGDDGSIPQSVRATVALDARTGAELWREDGDASLWNDDLVLLVEQDEFNNQALRFRAVRGSDGGTVWTFEPAEGVKNWTATGSDPLRPDRLITATESGAIEVRRFSDGSVVTAGEVPWRAFEDRNQGYTQLYSTRDKVFVITDDAGQQTMTVYAPDTLKSLWTRRTNTLNGFFGCGELLCISNGPSQIEALDPATGRAVWTSEGWDYGQPTGDGRLLTDTHRDDGWHGVVDASTGRKIARFEPGSTYLDRITGTVLNIGAIFLPSGSPTISQLTGTDEVVVRGSLGSSADNGCQLVADRLACAVGGGQLIVRDVG